MMKKAILLMLLLTLAAGLATAGNMAKNPGAEQSIDGSVWHKKLKIRKYVKYSEKVPGDWGVYSGGASCEFSRSTDAHSGKYSACLKFIAPHKDGSCSAAIIPGQPTDGHEKSTMIKLEAGKTYEFSFWLKSDMPSVIVFLVSWNNDGKRSWPRVTVYNPKGRVISRTLKPTGQWQEVIGRVTVPKESESAYLMLNSTSKEMKAGQCMYVDDVVINCSE